MTNLKELKNAKTFGFVTVGTTMTDYGYNLSYVGVGVLGDKITPEELESQLEEQEIVSLVHLQQDRCYRPKNKKVVVGNNLKSFDVNSKAPKIESYHAKELILVNYDKVTNELSFVSRESYEDNKTVTNELTRIINELKEKELKSKSIERALEVMSDEEKKQLIKELFQD